MCKFEWKVLYFCSEIWKHDKFQGYESISSDSLGESSEGESGAYEGENRRGGRWRMRRRRREPYPEKRFDRWPISVIWYQLDWIYQIVLLIAAVSLSTANCLHDDQNAIICCAWWSKLLCMMIKTLLYVVHDDQIFFFAWWSKRYYLLFMMIKILLWTLSDQ